MKLLQRKIVFYQELVRKKMNKLFFRSFYFIFFLSPFATNAQIGVKYDFDLTQKNHISNFKTIEKKKTQFKKISSLPNFNPEKLGTSSKVGDFGKNS